jgi:hypothetical protein
LAFTRGIYSILPWTASISFASPSTL